MYDDSNLFFVVKMAIVEYCLFRVKFVLPSQSSWLHYRVSRPEVFLASLKEKSDTQVRHGYRWHIGNVTLFSETSGYFAIGRTTRSTFEKFDTSTGNFVEEELETSPYTHCVFDAEIGFVGIAKKTSLSPTTQGIARRIEEVLSRTSQVTDNQIRVEITAIPDPENFLREVEQAYRVMQFAATFHGPNPIDADELFQKPLSTYLVAADGQKGKAQVEGHDLNREVIQAVTKSTAATGNEASVRLQRVKGARSIKINLRGGTLGALYDEEAHNPKQALDDLRGIYQRVSE
jgi:hypothetical protein